MRITINGQERSVPDASTIAEIIEAEGEPRNHVIVEVNGAYLPATHYEACEVAEGDRLEVILPAFGG